MELNINVVDAFADATFKGNPAAVIITPSWLNDELMQAIALENNLSETAFVKVIDRQHYEIRWFSPITEIEFCGHATLASAFVLFAQHSDLHTLNFFAKAVGNISVRKKAHNFIEMSFPNRQPKAVNTIPQALLEGLSIKPEQVLINDQAYFVVYQQEADVHNVVTDNVLLTKLAPYDVVVTAKASEYDFISRYFWPANGGDEDPVTGSIHSGLAPYWANVLNKTELIAYQASKRGGKLCCRVEGNKVCVSGRAVQYLAGKITI